jgi:hypothetical protein
LTNDQAYVFRVAAVNGIGTGAYSTASSVVTPVVFSPPSISGLQLWLDASDASTLFDATTGGSLVAADGGVARWQDKSGNARHATQSTSGNRPLRKTAIQGGKDALRFDGSNDSLSIASSTATFKFLHTSDATVFIAYKPSGADPDTLYSLIDNCRNGVTVAGYTLFYDDRSVVPRNNKILSAGGLGAGSYVVVSADNFSLANTFSVITNVVKSSDGTAANRSRLYRNGVVDSAVNSATGSTSADASHDLLFGASHTASSLTSFLNGDICEIIIYNSALSDINRAAVESYLMTKWSIA